MKAFSKTFILPLFILPILILGCAKTPTPLPLSEAEAKFIKSLKEEYGYDITIRQIENTLFIYHPMRVSLVDIKASEGGPKESKEAKELMSVKYIGASYQDRSFTVEYDIGLNKTYSKDYGYSSIYTEEFQKRQNNIFSALSGNYFDAQGSPERKVPDFLVLVIADIVKGIEIEVTTYIPDLKRAMSLAADITQEEYAKRYLTEIRGNTAIIDDATGSHLEYKPVVFTGFLARQIVNRVNFKYLRSSFPPSEDTVKEISKIAAETFGAYQFKDYNALTLKDLNSGRSEIVSPAQIEKLNENSPPGRFINIKFN